MSLFLKKFCLLKYAYPLLFIRFVSASQVGLIRLVANNKVWQQGNIASKTIFGEKNLVIIILQAVDNDATE